MTRWKRDEAGFTLTELLVVMVIMPLVIGAVAAAIILTEQSSGTTKSRLADSVSAQINSAYYVRDVQGAQFVTTNSGVGSPSVCVNPNLTSPSLVLGLYRPATSTVDTTPPQTLSNGLSIGYWLTSGSSPQLVRDACTVPTSGSPTFTSEVSISEDVTTSGVGVSILPAQFGSAASTGWTPTSASTTVTAPTTLASGTFSLPVASSLGFSTTPASVHVVATTAAENVTSTVTCTAPSSAPFTSLSCSGGSGVQIANPGAAVMQASISGINLSVTEPASNYTYSLQASPRASSTAQSGPPPNPGPPFGAALVSFSTVSMTSGSPVVTVNGNAFIGGATTVGGTATLAATGQIYTNGLITCTNPSAQVTAAGISQCGQTGTTPYSDPLAQYLPAAFPSQPNKGCPSTLNNATSGSFTLSPGIYTCQINVQLSVVVTLNPGVYQLQGGILMTGNSQLSVASGGGALLYVPSGQVTFNHGTTVTIPPLTPAQSMAAFGTTALQDVWFWQAAADTQQATLIGNGQVTSGTTGTAYVPGATVNIDNGATVVTGRIIAKRVTASGGAPVTLTGQ